MLVVLPPSETKADGGSDEPLDLSTLSFDELTPTRTRVAGALQRLSRSPKRARDVLGLGPTQLAELERNLQLDTAPTMPAIERYTGVLYDALDVASLTPAQRRRADARLAVGSALFGLVRANDRIPAYRLSGGSKLPRLGTMASVWKPSLGPVVSRLASDGLVVDLRSGAYRALAPIDAAVDVRVLSERADGTRRVVSHANKATKGRLARVLATSRRTCRSIDDVAREAEADGMLVERSGEQRLDIIVDA